MANIRTFQEEKIKEAIAALTYVVNNNICKDEVKGICNFLSSIVNSNQDDMPITLVHTQSCIATIIWQEEDIAEGLENHDYDCTKENIQTVLKYLSKKALKDCTDGWQEIDRAIRKAEIEGELKKKSLISREFLEDMAYELYKEQWKNTHVQFIDKMHLIQEYFSYCKEIMENGNEEKDLESLEEYEATYGYTSSVYASKEEFLQNEYQDKDYMRSILSVEMHQQYLDLRKEEAE